MEKKESTPEQYPLTLNSLRNACNQKSSRNPVVNYSEGEVGHTIRELEALHLVSEQWGARAAKYEHLANKAMDLHSKGIALICTLMLRGPQTLHELKTHSHRIFEFDDLDDVQFAVQHLIEHEPPMVTALPLQPGQKEGRYAHLLAGESDIPAPVAYPAPARRSSGLELRVDELETEVATLQERLAALEERWDDAVEGWIESTRALGRSVEPAAQAASEMCGRNAEAWRAAAGVLNGERRAVDAVLEASRHANGLLPAILESTYRPRVIAAQLLAHETALLAATVAGTAPMGTLRRLDALLATRGCAPGRRRSKRRIVP